ncbi:bifunctional metallophosphatase/5'-nucleotidase [Levilactobacillus hammesii]|uniref:2,3-cyclic-nucleotide 2-phosphodiesterase n=1 Tax=Levilactobacillus hammesii DSM 16381 TaxID=1423753 RepID=A0A0R1UK80_9LACO|nr:5'-nucleotidase C-terminal domain-containing protein [Levilactobacillus hammesii]KRL93673.1 hypothetical protein FD28_GL000856 [Levilactobacillus hammesii DSM 16381]
MVKVRILSTSDVHGYVYPTKYLSIVDTQPLGLLKAATIIDEARQAALPDEIVITIENGDWIQGSPFTTYLAKHPAAGSEQLTQLTTSLHYDAGVLGNHEFNYGLRYLQTAESDRDYPLLGANIIGGEAQQIVDAPYTIIERQGIRIAILGLTTAYVPTWEPADHLTGLKFESIVTTAKRWVPRLRKQADVVIVAYHGGFEADPVTGEPTERATGENEGCRLLQEVPGIDALVTGHQHRQLADIYHGVPTTQPGEKGAAVGLIELTLDKNKRVIAHDARLLSTATAKPAEWLANLVANTETRVQSWLDQPIGRLDGASLTVKDPMAARLHGHPYLQLVNTVEMAAGQTDIALTSLFNDDVRGLSHQPTIRELLNSYSYPNTLVVEELSGQNIRLALERCASFFDLAADGTVTVNDAFTTPKVQLYNYDIYSGLTYTFDLRRPVGQRVVQLNYHGSPVQPSQTLTVAMNQYRGNGGGDYPMFNARKIIREVSTDLPELIMNYLDDHDVVMGQEQTNFKVIS